MNLSPDGGVTPAPRRTGSIDAIHAAYESGMRFDGDIDIPVIDWRHYLEHQLDMHHSHQSFATRQRLQDRGTDDNQVIWFTDARPAEPMFDQTPEAFQVIDEWMENIRMHPWRSVAENKPPRAVDRCFDTLGNEIAAGDGVWDGILDARPAGRVHAGVPGPQQLAPRGGRPVPGRHLQVRPPERRRRHRRRRLRELGAERRRARPADADLPRGRVRLERGGPGPPVAQREVTELGRLHAIRSSTGVSLGHGRELDVEWSAWGDRSTAAARRPTS